MDDASLEAASAAIDNAVTAHQERDPEQAADFDAQQEQLRETLGPFGPGKTVQVTYERAEPAPTRDWNDVPPALQQRILDAVQRTRRGETVDLGDFSQHLDEADYQRLADSQDAEDADYAQAMRARKRGRPED